MNNILAPEILAHLTPARAPRVGDLAVFVDYKGRKVGCTVTRTFAAGEISTEAHTEVKVIGNEVYPHGTKFALESSKVLLAV